MSSQLLEAGVGGGEGGEGVELSTGRLAEGSGGLLLGTLKLLW